ncbi:acyltransferase [Rhodanobacter sp. T12-5]|uniref:acyltransferase family protein n=1 Tax=Rhodanobacter sp. T12-5 TaxID=2024611 RepID=UPI0011EC6ACC|nr:acyltransferase [Rhodanobacter sp. T12-5]KAA0072053.1 acyltransferase [Rhodanobacter sp. T12-5]
MNSICARSETGRIKAFDSLRGLAALGVVLWHYGAHFQAHPLAGVFTPFYRAGYLLVDFFFVLSGYVITRAYWTDSRRHRLGANVRSRIARLYPLHFFTLLIVAILQWLLTSHGDAPFIYTFNNGYHFLLNLAMINGIGFQEGYSFNGPAWSISTEFVVNIAFLAFIASTLLLRGVYLLSSLAICILLFVSSHSIVNGDRVLGYLDAQLVRCMLGFGTGIMLQLAHRRGWLAYSRLPSWAWDFLVLAVITALIIFMNTRRPHASVVSYLAVIALSALVLATVFKSKNIKKFLELRPLVFLGEISYSIYLVHFPLQLLFVVICSYCEITLIYNDLPIMALYFLLLISLSHLTYKYIEQPGQILLNRRRQARLKSAAAP